MTVLMVLEDFTECADDGSERKLKNTLLDSNNVCMIDHFSILIR